MSSTIVILLLLGVGCLGRLGRPRGGVKSPPFVLSPGNLKFPAAKARGEGRICWESSGDLGRTQKASVLSPPAQLRTPGCCWGVRVVSREQELCWGGGCRRGLYLLHRVWVSMRPHRRTPDALISAMSHLTAPPTKGGLLSSQVRRWLDGNQAPAGACCSPGAGATAACTGLASGPRVLSSH